MGASSSRRPAVHPERRPYEWVADTASLPPPPAWLISEATAPRPFLVKTPNAGCSNGTGRGSTEDLIHEGRRNPELFRIACALRGQGFDRAWIEYELVGVNQARCVPPLPPDEVAQIARSAARYPPVNPSHWRTA